ncbi:Ribonuclease [bioreactor metagenome]|uniref:Ribonuclease n=1 Tax=bioreactor metagenome TaxID=1076179 RepID=A0A644XBE6_9ZZZZ
MKLTFFGAAKTVTGSCHCVEVNGRKILIDCGLQQGRDERNNGEFDFIAGGIDCLIVTHAHIDHSGRIPLLVKQGFTGRILTTRLTGDLLSIMLRDSAHIQESDAQWQNQKGKRAGKDPVEPLYTVADAEEALKYIVSFEYGQMIDVMDGVRIRFVDAGHLLGSASVEMWLTEGPVTRKLIFSGDIGNVDQPIIRNPQFVTEADYVVMESTYGDRNHEIPEDYSEALASVIDETFKLGGNVIIPAFAVGRTQELLYLIRDMKKRGLVRSHPEFAVCVDSPLANEATRVFSGDLHGYMDEEALKIVLGGDSLLTFPGLRLVTTTDESKGLNEDKSSKVIISASGMCDAGRIRHHLKHNLWRSECSIVFVGYQGEGTLGRHLLEGAKSVKLFGEEIAVQAKIVNFKGMSSHADRDHLLGWISHVSPKPKQVFVVHGEASVTEIFAQSLSDKNFPAHAPLHEEVFDLAADTMLAAGVELEPRKAKEFAATGAPVFRELEVSGQKLLEVIGRNRGGSNKDLRKFEKELSDLIEKWNR